MKDNKNLGYCFVLLDQGDFCTFYPEKIDFDDSSTFCKLLDCTFCNIVRTYELEAFHHNAVLVVDDCGYFNYSSKNRIASALANVPIWGPALLVLEEGYDLVPVPYDVLYDLYNWESCL